MTEEELVDPDGDARMTEARATARPEEDNDNYSLISYESTRRLAQENRERSTATTNAPITATTAVANPSSTTATPAPARNENTAPARNDTTAPAQNNTAAPAPSRAQDRSRPRSDSRHCPARSPSPSPIREAECNRPRAPVNAAPPAPTRRTSPPPACQECNRLHDGFCPWLRRLLEDGLVRRQNYASVHNRSYHYDVIRLNVTPNISLDKYLNKKVCTACVVDWSTTIWFRTIPCIPTGPFLWPSCGSQDLVDLDPVTACLTNVGLRKMLLMTRLGTCTRRLMFLVLPVPPLSLVLSFNPSSHPDLEGCWLPV